MKLYLVFTINFFLITNNYAQNPFQLIRDTIGYYNQTEVKDRVNSTSAGKYFYFTGRVITTKPGKSIGSLLRTDGTHGNIEIAAQLVSDSSSTAEFGYDYIFSLYHAGAFVYFVGFNDSLGFELWAVDTSGSTPWLVKEFTKGQNDRSWLSSQTVFNNELYLIHQDKTLWKTNSSLKGTLQLVKKKNKTKICNVRAAETRIYFFKDKIKGVELWKLEKYAKKPQLVKTFPGYSIPDQNPSIITTNGNNICFILKTETGIPVLINSNGTKKNTIIIQEYNKKRYIFNHEAVVFKNEIFYIRTDEGYRNTEIWRTDGTVENTKLFYKTDSNSVISNLVVGKEKLFYFVRSKNVRENYEVRLFTYNLKEDQPGSATEIKISTDDWIPEFHSVFIGDYLFFQNRDFDIWRTDGSTQNTHNITQEKPWDKGKRGYSLLGSSNNYLYFIANKLNGDLLIRISGNR